MTIGQRIELRRLGYTKEEIAELAELEKTTPEPAPAAEPEPTPEPEQPAAPVPEPADNPDMNSQLLAAINNLTIALQARKVDTVEQPVLPKVETADDIFSNFLKG